MPLFLLRCFQIGLRMSDLDDLEYGEIVSMFIESENDTCEYQPLATQDDMDRF